MALARDLDLSAQPTLDLRAAEAALGFDKERAVMLHMLLPCVAALAFIWFGWFVERGNPLTWVAPLLLVAAVWGAYMLIAHRPQAATALVVVGLVAGVGWSATVSGNNGVLLALVPTASAALLLVGLRWGLFVALVASVLVWLVPPAEALGASRGMLLLVLWGSVWLGWIAFRSMRVLMTWAWEYLSQVQGHLDALRDSRAELARTLASLDHAYGRLQQANADLERARRAAEEARRFKAEFAANISHELRTPLNLVLGFSEMMIVAPQSYGEALPLAYRSEIDAIYRNARHLSGLVDDVLDLSGIEAQRLALMLEETQLADVVDEAASAVEALYRQRGLFLRTELAPGLPPLQID
ncbi:MAG: HAMP domain-containing histidine kinase, partial [Chloroflexales bacterium]|nr:HAMP domain-containing histidine kinase [Chloroflexales bacterium]